MWAGPRPGPRRPRQRPAALSRAVISISPLPRPPSWRVSRAPRPADRRLRAPPAPTAGPWFRCASRTAECCGDSTGPPAAGPAAWKRIFGEERVGMRGVLGGVPHQSHENPPPPLLSIAAGTGWPGPAGNCQGGRQLGGPGKPRAGPRLGEAGVYPLRWGGAGRRPAGKRRSAAEGLVVWGAEVKADAARNDQGGGGLA